MEQEVENAIFSLLPGACEECSIEIAGGSHRFPPAIA